MGVIYGMILLAQVDETTVAVPGAGLLDSISASSLLASMFWGGIATGFLIYGYRQKALRPFLVGVALTFVSYCLLNSALWMSLACIGILAVFIFLKKQGY